MLQFGFRTKYQEVTFRVAETHSNLEKYYEVIKNQMQSICILHKPARYLNDKEYTLQHL